MCVCVKEKKVGKIDRRLLSTPLPNCSMSNSIDKIDVDNFFSFVEQNFRFPRQFSLDKMSLNKLRKLSENLIRFDAKFCRSFSMLPILVSFLVPIWEK